MQGSGFSMVPNDAVGVWAISNDDPLAFRNSQDNANTFDVIVGSDNLLTCVPRVLYTHSVPNYLGAILSADRQTVYWVNETRPLP